MILYPNVIAPLFNTFTELNPGPLRAKIEALAQRVDFPLKKLYVMDASKRTGHSNAYFYGFGQNKRIVLFDTLLSLKDEEVIGVLAHELGHWMHMHVFKGFVIAAAHLLAMFAVFGYVKGHPGLFHSFGFTSSNSV